MKSKLVVFSLILVLLLCFSNVFAVSKFADTAGTKYDTAVEKLSNSKIIDGFEDGTFRPLASITRAQLCKLLVESLKLQNVTNVVLTQFSDVNTSHWFYSYVKTAVDNNIVVGFPDGTFKPNKSVTFAEAVTMIIRAMGVEKTMTDKTWPTAYMTQATSLGLLKDVEYKDVNDAAPRGEVSIGLYNMVTKMENDKAAAEAEKKAQEEKAQKEAAAKTPSNFAIVTSVEDDDDDYYAKLNGITKKQLVTSLFGTKNYKYTKLKEIVDRVIGYNTTSKNNEIEVTLSYEAKDLDAAKSISKVEDNLVTYTDKTTFDKSLAANVNKYKYYTFIRITCEYDEDDGEITFTKVEKLGTGLDSVKFTKADRTFIDSDNYVFAIVKGFNVNDTIKKGVVTTDSSSSDTSDYLFAIAGVTSTSGKKDYVKIGTKKYEIDSKSKDFTEGAVVCYTKDDDGIVKLVRNIPATLLDKGSGVQVIDSVSGRTAGDQTVTYVGSSSEVDYFNTTNTKKYKDYAILKISVSKNKSGVVVIDDFNEYDSLDEIKFAAGDRTLIDTTNDIFAVFKGLDEDDSYKDGKYVDPSVTTTYTVSYKWLKTALTGVSPSPSAKNVAAGSTYTVPTFTKSGYTITTNPVAGTKITVNSDKTINITYTETTPVITQCKITYTWATSADQVSGVNLAALNTTVAANTYYDIKVPAETADYYFDSPDGTRILVATDVTIRIRKNAKDQGDDLEAARRDYVVAKSDYEDALDAYNELVNGRGEFVASQKISEKEANKDAKQDAWTQKTNARKTAQTNDTNAQKEIDRIEAEIKTASGDRLVALQEELETAKANKITTANALTTAKSEEEAAKSAYNEAENALNAANDAIDAYDDDIDTRKQRMTAAKAEYISAATNYKNLGGDVEIPT